MAITSINKNKSNLAPKNAIIMEPCSNKNMQTYKYGLCNVTTYKEV